MSYDHLYRPQPCSAWSIHELRVVGAAYRKAGGHGLDGPTCLDVAVGAYLAAGGGKYGAFWEVRDMIASLSREHGDWLWGPAQAWRDQHRAPVPEPTADTDLFEPEEHHA